LDFSPDSRPDGHHSLTRDGPILLTLYILKYVPEWHRGVTVPSPSRAADLSDTVSARQVIAPITSATRA